MACLCQHSFTVIVSRELYPHLYLYYEKAFFLADKTVKRSEALRERELSFFFLEQLAKNLEGNFKQGDKVKECCWSLSYIG